MRLLRGDCVLVSHMLNALGQLSYCVIKEEAEVAIVVVDALALTRKVAELNEQSFAGHECDFFHELLEDGVGLVGFDALGVVSNSSLDYGDALTILSSVSGVLPK